MLVVVTQNLLFFSNIAYYMNGWEDKFAYNMIFTTLKACVSLHVCTSDSRISAAQTVDNLAGSSSLDKVTTSLTNVDITALSESNIYHYFVIIFIRGLKL
jgi:hypothetical protein